MDELCKVKVLTGVFQLLEKYLSYSNASIEKKSVQSGCCKRERLYIKSGSDKHLIVVIC